MPTLAWILATLTVLVAVALVARRPADLRLGRVSDRTLSRIAQEHVDLTGMRTRYDGAKWKLVDGDDR